MTDLLKDFKKNAQKLDPSDIEIEMSDKGRLYV